MLKYSLRTINKLYIKIKIKFKIILHKNRFFNSIIEKSEDEILTDADQENIITRLKELNLTIKDLKDIKVKIFKNTFEQISKHNFISEDQEKYLDNLQLFFNISDSEVFETKKDIFRIKTLMNIKHGILPIQTNLIVNLKKNESASWIEKSTLLESRVTSRSVEGGCRGINITLVKGVSFRVGHEKGTLVSNKELVKIADGNLIITNQRILFQNLDKSFDIKLNKIFNLNVIDDCIFFNTSNRQKPYTIQFHDKKNYLIIKSLLSYSISKCNI